MARERERERERGESGKDGALMYCFLCFFHLPGDLAGEPAAGRKGLREA